MPLHDWDGMCLDSPGVNCVAHILVLLGAVRYIAGCIVLLRSMCVLMSLVACVLPASASTDVLSCLRHLAYVLVGSMQLCLK
jgi:hypothetical protein